MFISVLSKSKSVSKRIGNSIILISDTFDRRCYSFLIFLSSLLGKGGEGKQIDVQQFPLVLPANPFIPGSKQPGTIQSGKNPPGLLQLICFQIPSNNFARLDHELTFNEAIESMAFKICDVDSDEGLSWEEVKACDVS